MKSLITRNNGEPAWLRLAPIGVLLLVWQLAAAVIASPLLPGPLLVLDSLWLNITEDDLFHHLGLTLFRVGASFALAMFVGAVAGILMAAYKHVDISLDALLIIGLNIPALVTIILCYVWFGLTEVAAVIAVAANKIPTVTVIIREGARAVDRKLLLVADAFRVGPRDRFFKVYLPQLYPYLMAAARNGLALIWKIVLVVELLGRSDGVGFKLGTFFQFFDIASILAYTLAFAALVLMIEAWVLKPVDRRLDRWRT